MRSKVGKVILLMFVGLLLVTVLFTGCSKSKEVDKVSVGLLKLTSSAPIFIGIEKGFFKEEGLDLDIEWFEAAQPIAVATAANKVDIGATGITASLFNMVGSGQMLTIVADKGREHTGYSSSAILVRNDLWEQGTRKIEDLKGKRIGITQTGSTFHYMIGRLLEEKGLTLNDVEIVSLGKIGALMASLQSGQVDAVILNEPNISKVESAGYGKILAQVGDVMDYQTSAIFFSPKFDNDKSAGVKFLKGYIKSTRYYYDAVLNMKDGKVVPGTNYNEVINIIASYTGVSVEDVKSGLPYLDRDGNLLSSDIQTQIDWYASHKMIDKPISSSQVVNSALWQRALEELK
jgi:NitT/TauT family transport system substrate-binding protein